VQRRQRTTSKRGFSASSVKVKISRYSLLVFQRAYIRMCAIDTSKTSRPTVA